MIVPHPISFQIFVATSVGRKYSGSAKKYTGSKPKAQNVIHGSFRWRQHDDNDARQYNPGEKWGIYEIDCATRLNLWNALIQQKREKDRRRKPENNIVQADQRILKNPGKVGRLKEQNSKCSSPTHSPHIPLIGLKSLNASWMPYNGP